MRYSSAWKCGTQKNHELLHFELESAYIKRIYKLEKPTAVGFFYFGYKIIVYNEFPECILNSVLIKRVSRSRYGASNAIGILRRGTIPNAG